MPADADPKLKEYETVVGQFRNLTDIRFRLLGLLPLGTVGTMIVLKDKDAIIPLVGLFGVVITAALFVYHLRNDQLYNELVGRAAQLERELGLFEGSFVQRPTTWHRLGGTVRVEHGWPVKVVYLASAALWLSFALHPLARSAVYGGHLPQSAPESKPAAEKHEASASDPIREALATLMVLPMAVAFAWAANSFVNRTRDASARRVKRAVAGAMHILEQIPTGRPIDPDVLKKVARRLRRVLGDGPAREAVYQQRLGFYLNPRYTERYLGSPPREQTVGPELAARVLGQTIDQPARWIFDIYLQRR